MINSIQFIQFNYAFRIFRCRPKVYFLKMVLLNYLSENENVHIRDAVDDESYESDEGDQEEDEY